jgi:hypothetical protein
MDMEMHIDKDIYKDIDIYVEKKKKKKKKKYFLKIYD